MQLILFITSAMISALVLILLGFIIGYLFGKESSKGWLKINKIEGNTITLEDDLPEAKLEDKRRPLQYQYDKDGNLKVSIYDEPSGIVMRPTPQELKKMNEDTATKEAKEAMSETFRNESEPKI